MYFDMNGKLSVIRFGRIEQQIGRWHNGTTVSYFRTMYLIDGELDIITKDKVFSMKAGDTVLFPPNTRYAPGDSKGCIYCFADFYAAPAEPKPLYFKIDNSYSYAPENYTYSYSSSKETVISVGEYTPAAEINRVGDIFAKCTELNIPNHPFDKMLLDCYMKEVLICLSLNELNDSGFNPLFMKMESFIKQNYAQNIGLPEVAERLRISQSYAAKLFKKHTGARCCDYINSVRLSAAGGLLANTDMRIGQIAEAVGYRSPYYFSRMFAKEYGMTAREYRHKNKDNN